MTKKTIEIEYTKDGFTVNKEDQSIHILWADITQIHAFKTDLITTDRVDLEIISKNQRIILNEEMPIWLNMLSQLNENIPGIQKDWYIEIIHPAFERNFTILYEKPN